MKKFLITLLLFGGLFFMYDKLFIAIRNQASNFDFDNRLDRILKGEMNYELIILGSSRANSHVATWMLEEKLGMDSFNLAYGGANDEFQLFVLQSLIRKNNKPRLIIKLLDDDIELLFDEGKNFRFDRLYPLVKYQEVRDRLVEANQKDELLSQFFILHQINKSNFDFRTPLKVNDTIEKYGAKPSFGYDKTNIWIYEKNVKYPSNLEDKRQVNSLLEIQRICKENNVKLIFATATGYRQFSEEWFLRINELIQDDFLIFKPNRNDSLLSRGRFYADDNHRNLDGAKIYTKELIDFILANHQELDF